jgi:hypothetical protein
MFQSEGRVWLSGANPRVNFWPYSQILRALKINPSKNILAYLSEQQVLTQKVL